MRIGVCAKAGRVRAKAAARSNGVRGIGRSLSVERCGWEEIRFGGAIRRKRVGMKRGSTFESP
jgi:hypothetical protein